MFNSLMIEGFIIYAVLYGLLGYAVTRRYRATVQKVVFLILLFLLTFPGFLLCLVFWSGVISAFSSEPLHP
jgi:hypothetical protein